MPTLLRWGWGRGCWLISPPGINSILKVRARGRLAKPQEKHPLTAGPWSRHPQGLMKNLKIFFFPMPFDPEIRKEQGKELLFPPSISTSRSPCQSICSSRWEAFLLPSSLFPLILPPSTSVPLSVSDSLLEKKKNQAAFNLIGSCCLTLTFCGLEGFQCWFYQN